MIAGHVDVGDRGGFHRSLEEVIGGREGVFAGFGLAVQQRGRRVSGGDRRQVLLNSFGGPDGVPGLAGIGEEAGHEVVPQSGEDEGQNHDDDDDENSLTLALLWRFKDAPGGRVGR